MNVMLNCSLLGYNPFGFDSWLGTYMDCTKKCSQEECNLLCSSEFKPKPAFYVQFSSVQIILLYVRLRFVLE